jgi:hypothetical protein
VFVLTAVPAEAATRESSLLGIKLWRTWRDVLGKHGQPSRIEVGAVTAPMGGQAQAGAGPMMGGGGLPGGGPMIGGTMGSGGAPMPGMGGMGMGSSGMAAQMGRSMAMSRMRGGTQTMGSPMGPPPGAGGGMMGGPMPGAPMMGGGGSSKFSAMGMGGGPSIGAAAADGGGGDLGLGGFNLPGGSGGGMAGFAGGQSAPSQEGEVTWVYEKGPLTYLFLFNKDGRVIQISQFGYRGGGATSRGISLGAPVKSVYSKYGWANSSSKAGNQLTLDYSHKANVAFQLLNRGKGAQVVGVTVAITERDRIPGAG